jgi:UDP-N-acetylglucosamine 2-epimerase (non-hydrolysing)
MTIFGTRPEAIKMAPLVKELKSRSEIETLVCVTAQHREMLDQVLDIFNIKPDYDLNIMKQSQSLSDITTEVLKGLEGIIASSKPDMVLVHGDTTTTFAGSLAAFYAHTGIGHVEAGLRTFDKYFPFPEEMNRKLTSAMADIHFAPTMVSKANLLREGIDKKNIFVTGNTAIDAMASTVEEGYSFRSTQLQNIDFSKRTIMVTAHRRENLGRPLEDICRALKSIAEEYSDINIIYLVHLNPKVQETAHSILDGVPGVYLLPPLDIKETHNLMNRSYMILTDSGGIQEEAPHLGKPVLVLRDVTERPEAAEAGTLKVIGTDTARIVQETRKLLDCDEEYEAMANAVNPYGDGKAAARIADSILYYFGASGKRPEDYKA